MGNGAILINIYFSNRIETEGIFHCDANSYLVRSKEGGILISTMGYIAYMRLKRYLHWILRSRPLVTCAISL